MAREICWCTHEPERHHEQGCNSCRIAVIRLFQWRHRFQPIWTLPPMPRFR